MCRKKGLCKQGTQLEDVIGQLGDPDLTVQEKNDDVGLHYGRCVMNFSNGKLVNYSFRLLQDELRS